MLKYLLIIGMTVLTSLAQAQDILDKIKGLDEVVSVVEKSSKNGLREFHIQFRQNVDHTNRKLGTFNQKLVLLHRDENEPMVLQTSGYMIYRIAETGIARMFQTNQLQIEHRFFEGSTPGSSDWSKLDIQQSADDFHAITVAFKKIYKKNWVNTGASKGGMTSTYHRFFYPDDVAGTVADVAPLSFSRSDQRYNRFLRNVGGEQYKECRDELAHFQKHMLKHREKFVSRVKGTFTQLGSNEVAYEHAVIEMPFYFWQYGNPESTTSGCAALPNHHDDDAMYGFLNMHADVSDYTDNSLTPFLPYFYQAATQLGGPDNITDHLELYRMFEFGLDQYTPKGITLPYRNNDMRALDQWVRTEASDIMFIYGTYDPWTAAEYSLGKNENVFKYYVPGGNHGANFTKLPGEEKSLAIAHLTQWLGKAPVTMNVHSTVFGEPEKTLEDLEFEFKREHGLR